MATISVVTLTRRYSILAAVLFGCALGFSTGAGAAGTRADVASITVTYTNSASIQAMLDDGMVVGSGSSIPAGSYQILVQDPDDMNPDFIMTGPGISINSNLNSSGMGIDHPAIFGPFTFQPGSSYTIQDALIGGSTITFSVSAASTVSGGPGSSGGGGSFVSSPGSSGSGGTRSSGGTGSSPSGSTMLGTLRASVSAAGKTMMTFGGKAVAKLKAGRYTIIVKDQSKTGRFILAQISKQPITLSGAAAPGSSSHTVTLSAGEWFFAASTKGPKTYFSVNR